MSEANKSTTNKQIIYDLVIIGAGPAGLTASIYASRYRLSNLVIGKVLGGELSLAHHVCNFPGFIGLPGLELAEKWKEQVEKLGAQVLLKEVGKVEMVKGLLPSATKFEPAPTDVGTLSNLLPQDKPSYFKIITSDKEEYYSKTIIVATGSERRRLNIPGEKEYTGKGVSYCPTCDVALFKDKIVAIVGGADSAVSGAVHSANFAKKVYLIYRKDKLRAEAMWLTDWQRLEKEKGETIYNTNVLEILGNGQKVTGIKLDQPYQGKETLEIDGIFIEIGGVPGTAVIQPLGVVLDQTGHVLVNDHMETNVAGLFSAGDVCSKSAVFKQAIMACAQGARAAAASFEYLKKQTAPQIKGI